MSDAKLLAKGSNLNLKITIKDVAKASHAWASADFFPGEGNLLTFCLKKQRKRYYFYRKSLKTYYFWPGGAPLALPCGRPWSHDFFDILLKSKLHCFL
jgi:hypothetical protein